MGGDGARYSETAEFAFDKICEYMWLMEGGECDITVGIHRFLEQGGVKGTVCV